MLVKNLFNRKAILSLPTVGSSVAGNVYLYYGIPEHVQVFKN